MMVSVKSALVQCLVFFGYPLATLSSITLSTMLAVPESKTHSSNIKSATPAQHYIDIGLTFRFIFKALKYFLYKLKGSFKFEII